MFIIVLLGRGGQVSNIYLPFVMVLEAAFEDSGIMRWKKPGFRIKSWRKATQPETSTWELWVSEKQTFVMLGRCDLGAVFYSR